MSWPSVKLNSVALLDRDSVHPNDTDENTPYIGLEHVDSDGQLKCAETVSSAGLKSNKFRFSTEHVLFGKLRPYLRKIARPDFSGVCSTDIIPLRPVAKLDRDYLYHYLRTPAVVDFATSRCSGANLPRLSPRQLAAFQIPLPPLAEQKRIAGILDAADALRAKRRESIEQLDTLIQSTFLEMFGDPVTNPKGWPMKNFGDVCDSRLGKMLDAKKQTGSDPRPYMRNINVQWGKLDLSTVWEMDFGPNDRDKYRLLPNDVLICEGGAGVAQTAVWRGEIDECYFQKSLHRVRPKPIAATSEYIAYLIRMLMREGSDLFRLVSSATIPHLTGIKLKTLQVPVPCLELQHRFAKINESIRQQQARIHAHLTELDTLFSSLQSRAFRGEL